MCNHIVLLLRNKNQHMFHWCQCCLNLTFFKHVVNLESIPNDMFIQTPLSFWLYLLRFSHFNKKKSKNKIPKLNHIWFCWKMFILILLIKSMLKLHKFINDCHSESLLNTVFFSNKIFYSPEKDGATVKMHTNVYIRHTKKPRNLVYQSQIVWFFLHLSSPCTAYRQCDTCFIFVIA